MGTLLRFETDSLPRSLAVDPPMSDEEFEAFCMRNDDVRIERTREGAIRMHPPTGLLSDDGNVEIIHQLRSWWDTHNNGRVLGSNAGFFLPDGSMLSPDAAYVTAEQLKGLKRKQLTGFPRLCPAFVIELLSPSDSLAETSEKMKRWIASGAQLGWLIDPSRRVVTIYQAGLEPVEGSALKVDGCGPVEGFTLDLGKVWRCYEVPEE
jgi:Uma2 family endonuclease